MITQARLKELLSYDPDTGVWMWLNLRNGYWGKVGYLRSDGYVQISVDGRRYLAHRLAVLYMTGAWPINETDRRQLGKEAKSDNCWSNIRQATRSQNIVHCGIRRNNTSGATGVSWNKLARKWVVHLGKRYLWGGDDFEMACLIRYEAASAAFGEFV